MADTARTNAREHARGPRLACLFNRHEPAGRRASWNGEVYVSRCEYCDTPIFRVKKGKWKRDRRRRED